jgi:NAD(P)-dependent dehydrogenase (short-subunit alcohol dehydrogenase family)
MTPFRGKSAVVTGASSGIGRAVAVELARQGALVGAVGRNIESLQQTAELAGPCAGGVRCYRSDLAQDDDLRRLGDLLNADLGQLDVLVHSAGAIGWGLVGSAPVGEVDRLYRLHVRVPYVLTQMLLPMLRERAGQVVFMNSSIVHGVRAGAAAYAASKAAMQALASALRDEVNSLGIRVLSVYPGRTATPTQEAAARHEGRNYEPDRLIQPEDVASVVVHSLLLPRSAEMTDVHVRPMKKS